MNSKTILVLIMALLICGGLSARNYGNKSLGIQFGSSSGSGYAMRWIGQTHGLQITLGALSTGDNDVKFQQYLWNEDIDSDAQTVEYTREGRRTTLSAGLNYIHVLDQSDRTRFFVAMGGAYRVGREQRFTRVYNLQQGTYPEYELDYDIPMTEETVNVDKWTVGAGPGFEFVLDRRFRFTIDLPVTYSSDDKIVMYVPQVGLHYYFR